MKANSPLNTDLPNTGFDKINIELHPLYKSVLIEYRKLKSQYKSLQLIADNIAIKYNLPSYTVLFIIDDNYGLLS